MRSHSNMDLQVPSTHSLTVLSVSTSTRTPRSYRGVSISKKSLVAGTGLEPVRVSPFDFKSNAYTNSATRPLSHYITFYPNNSQPPHLLPPRQPPLSPIALPLWLGNPPLQKPPDKTWYNLPPPPHILPCPNLLNL